jgi:hypothetical protein
LAEGERLALEPVPLVESALADWLDWTIHHPAYRRAVPHNRSFLREKEFAVNLLTLLHELTHVFSFLGPVGYALLALQLAAIRSELLLRSKFHRPDPEAPRGDGLAELSPGDAPVLLFAEYQLGLVAKMLILVEVWRPIRVTTCIVWALRASPSSRVFIMNGRSVDIPAERSQLEDRQTIGSNAARVRV